MRTALLLKAISIADGKSNPRCRRGSFQLGICFVGRNKARCQLPLEQEIKFANIKNPRFSHCMQAGADFCLERVAVLLDDPLPLLMVSPRHRHPI
jgi:hypothetical protein